MREYVGPPQQVRRVAFVPGDPVRLVAVGQTSAYVWEVGRPDPLELHFDLEGAVPRLAVAPAGGWLSIYSGDVQKCWNVYADPVGPPMELTVPGVLAADLHGEEPRLTTVCRVAQPEEFHVLVAPFGRRAPAVSRRQARAILPIPAELVPDVRGIEPGEWLQYAHLSADGGRFAVSAREKAVHVWDVGTGQPPRTLPLRGFPCGLLFSPDGSRLFVDAGTTLYLHDSDTLELLAKWKAKYSYVPGLAWSPDGRLLARTDNSTTVRVYEVSTGRQVMAVGGKRGRLGCVAFAPDGLTLATGTHEGPVRVWDVE